MTRWDDRQDVKMAIEQSTMNGTENQPGRATFARRSIDDRSNNDTKVNDNQDDGRDLPTINRRSTGHRDDDRSADGTDDWIGRPTINRDGRR